MEPSKSIWSSDKGFNLLFIKRFIHLLPWLFPSWRCRPSLLVVLLLCLGLLEQVIIYNIGLVPSKYYKVLGEKDHAGFWTQTATAVAFIVAQAFVKSTTKYVQSVLYIVWREKVTQNLHHTYYKEVLYYTVNMLNKTVDNPDQRITQDVDRLCDHASQIIVPLIISPFTIAYYIYEAQKSSGYIGPVSVIVFFLIATVINKVLMTPVVHYVFLRDKMEGNFRFKHMQIRSNSESAAFFRSGKIEEQSSNRHLHNLITTQRSLILRHYALNFSINMFDYLGSIVSYIALAFPIFLGTYDNLSAPDLSALISANAFVVIYLISCFTKLIDLADMATRLAGNTHRVVELREDLEKLLKCQRNRGDSRPDNMQGFGWKEMATSKEADNDLTTLQEVHFEPSADTQVNVQETSMNSDIAIETSDVTYTAPNSSIKLCIGLNFSFKQGTNVLVTGASGCGKSSLLRVINGIWPELRGSVVQNMQLKPHLLLFLPQKPYFTDGSLRQQIIFPFSEFDTSHKFCVEDEEIHEILSICDLSHICTRVKDLDTQVDWNWYDVLSPGEMERLSFARLFYHKPRFAVLDEATSQVGFPMERVLYEKCASLNITLLSVGHRDSIRKFHDIELNIEIGGSWSLKPISRTEPGACFVPP
ncbi:lysosomal cobalamin transporter ABCD4-like [Mya arenaria]|uniref:lysosomal cobalamin transporter ABCD4-like n=1 Tax=Mya arenaria TaxID=6604 RepID=UPI0022E26A00|nr:lysosomal cobalamin transporter ABCD4-like [Mya arenaria]XP_052767296.1 lysosomal cobalamin transporter ABCD4-like [Mya arenaria]XP_052767298.1 lysosomal cobalamin transporter ABCD4-like [Mya arenaria]